MKLFLESLIVFFGTLMAAALVALGEAGSAELALTAPADQPAQVVGWPGLR